MVFVDPLHCTNTDDGIDYKGTISKTVTGIPCQKWNSLKPHSHSYTYMMANEENYCRIPDQYSSKPWCYTTDPYKRWDFCDVPKCSKYSFNLQ